MPQAAISRRQRTGYQVMWLLVVGLLATIAAPNSSFAQQTPAATNPEASSQLFEGVFANDMAAVQAAVSAGANLSVRNDWGLTAVELAVDKGYFGIAHYLLDVRNFRRQQAVDQQQKTPIPEPFVAGQGNDAPFEPGKARASPTPGVLSGPLPREQISSPQASTLGTDSSTAEPNPFDTRTATKGTPAITGQIQGPDLPPSSGKSRLPASPLAPQSSITVPEPPIDRVSSTVQEPPRLSSKPASISAIRPVEPVEAPKPIQAKPAVAASKAVSPSRAVPAPPAPVATMPKPAPPIGKAVAEALKVATQPLTSAPQKAPETPSSIFKNEANPESARSPNLTSGTPQTSAATAIPETSVSIAPKANVATPISVVAETESPGVFDGLFNRLTSILPDTKASPEPIPETNASASPSAPKTQPVFSAPDAAKEKTQISALLPKQPVAASETPSVQPIAPLRPALKAQLGSNLPLGRPYQQSTSQSCVQKEQGRVAFCLEPVSWPRDIENAFDVSTIMYQGRQAIVRYDGGASTASHALFEQESFDGIAAWARGQFGTPVSERTERIAMPGETPVENHILLWQGSDPEAGLATTLEIRSIDNVRNGFPDRRYGVIRLFRDSGKKVFPQLSTMDLMLIR